MVTLRQTYAKELERQWVEGKTIPSESEAEDNKQQQEDRGREQQRNAGTSEREYPQTEQAEEKTAHKSQKVSLRNQEAKEAEIAPTTSGTTWW